MSIVARSQNASEQELFSVSGLVGRRTYSKSDRVCGLLTSDPRTNFLRDSSVSGRSVPLRSHSRLAIGKSGKFILHKAMRGERLSLGALPENDAKCKYSMTLECPNLSSDCGREVSLPSELRPKRIRVPVARSKYSKPGQSRSYATVVS